MLAGARFGWHRRDSIPRFRSERAGSGLLVQDGFRTEAEGAMINQRGAGRIGLVIWLAIMGSGVFAAVRCVPVRMAVMQLHDFADEQVKFAAAGRRFDQAKLLKEIQTKARELELPLSKDSLALDLRQNELVLKMKHKVEVNLEVYTWVWEYNKSFRHIRM